MASRSMIRKSLLVACAAVTLVASPAWAATRSHSDLEALPDVVTAKPGGTTTVHGTVANTGPDRTTSPFTVTVTLPAGVTAEGPFFPTSCVVGFAGHMVRCQYPAGLGLHTATALVPVRIAKSLRVSVDLVGWVTVTSPDDSNPKNNMATVTIHVRP